MVCLSENCAYAVVMNTSLSFPSTEAALLTLCARTTIDAATQEAIAAKIREGVNWTTLVTLAQRHRVTALLQRSLETTARNAVPDYILRGLALQNRAQAMRNLFQTGELLRLLKRLDEEGIAALPFKGPMLGTFVYGDPALRPFLDLDLLLHREDFERVKKLLLEDGFRTYREMNPKQEAAFLRTQMGYELIHDKKKIVLELHWAFLNKVHAFDLDPESVWKRAVVRSLAGVEVRAMAPEDLLLYLCAHGTKSLWERLSWICDVAELVHCSPSLDWEALLDRAARLHSERFLFLGLALAHELLDAPLPGAVQAQLYKDSAIKTLVDNTRTHLFLEEKNPFTLAEKAAYHLNMRERFRDRLPYYAHLLRLVFEPNEEDESFIALPERLALLYYVLRPVRVMTASLRSRTEKNEMANA